MNPAEVRAAREILGLSQERLAADFAVTEREVRAWEDGAARIPKRFAQQLAWLAALKRQDDALAAAGLPECGWVAAWELEAVPDGAQEARRLEALNAHAGQCSVCQTRIAYVEEHLAPLPEMPMPAWIRVLGAFIERVERLPRWLRPAAYGAAGVGLFTLARATLSMLVAGPSLELLRMGAMGVVIGGYGGAVGGLAYHAVRDPFRRFGRAGAYLTGIAVVGAYLLAFAIPERFLSAEPVFADPAAWIVGGVLTVVFGLLIGHWWFRDAAPASPAGR